MVIFFGVPYPEMEMSHKRREGKKQEHWTQEYNPSSPPPLLIRSDNGQACDIIKPDMFDK